HQKHRPPKPRPACRLCSCRILACRGGRCADTSAPPAYLHRPVQRVRRSGTHKNKIMSEYDDKLQSFLDFVLSQYVQEGVGELDREKLPHLLELKYKAVRDAAEKLGGVARISEAFVGFQKHLY